MRLLNWVFVLMIFLPGGRAFGADNHTPSVGEVSQEALRYARLEAATIGRWEKKVRQAPLLPRFQFGFERRLRNNVNLNVEDSVAVNSSGITVGPTQQKQIQNADNDFNIEVKAVWYLDQLLFSKEDLEISNEARELAHERERILNQVRQYYFKRERGLKELSTLEKMGGRRFEKELKQFEIAEASSALDDLTGGWFSAQMGVLP